MQKITHNSRRSALPIPFKSCFKILRHFCDVHDSCKQVVGLIYTRQFMSQACRKLVACDEVLHQERNPLYFWITTVRSTVEVYKILGNLTPETIIPPSYAALHQRPRLCASMPSNLETHAKDLRRTLHKMQPSQS